VSKKFGEWYHKTNKTEDTNKLTLLAFKIIAILHNTLLAMFINLLEPVSKGLFRNRSQNRCHTLWIAATYANRAPFMMLFRRGNRKKFTHRTLLTWRLRTPDQGRKVDFFLFPRLKNIMKSASFADVAVIQERVTAIDS
jgi:hypothetical protein